LLADSEQHIIQREKMRTIEQKKKTTTRTISRAKRSIFLPSCVVRGALFSLEKKDVGVCAEPLLEG
jgi:hypothetical protein